MKKYLVTFLLSAMCSQSFAVATCPANKGSYFCIPSDQIENSEITVTKFYTIPSTILSLYNKEISELPYPVTLAADWESPFFGAGVSLYENSFRLMILGGMTRMKEMTTDAYAAIVCHEVGHMLGGDPKQTIVGSDWASAEGQADHFSASECLPRYFKKLGLTSEEEILKRVEKAGADFIGLASKVESDPKSKFFKRARVNLPEVKETIINRYPTLQCRYETYRNPKVRPTCWFKD